MKKSTWTWKNRRGPLLPLKLTIVWSIFGYSFYVYIHTHVLLVSIGTINRRIQVKRIALTEVFSCGFLVYDSTCYWIVTCCFFNCYWLSSPAGNSQAMSETNTTSVTSTSSIYTYIYTWNLQVVNRFCAGLHPIKNSIKKYI